jgi:CheY-like chemotaxis protein
MANNVNTVFLIDDDEATNYFNLIMIESSKIAGEIFVYDSGTMALDTLQDMLKHEKQLPELIFLDINMPVMNGWQFLEEIKALGSKITSKVRVVMLSASDSPQDVSRSQQYAFVKAYLSKPLTVDKIIGLSRKKLI